MALPRLILTGASGFIGRHLLDAFKEEFRIVGLARRSQLHCGAPVHNNITWYQVDIGDKNSLAAAFRYIRESGGADYVIHLAAHYDFTGENHPEYTRTNVEGMRNVLDECRSLNLKRFIFSSSLAACQFPNPGKVLTETNPPDGDHVYAVTKRIGEEMLAEYDDDVPSCIMRLAALFSDWCEYPPLYIFLETWLSNVWNSNGSSAAAGPRPFPTCTSARWARSSARSSRCGEDLEQREILIASPSETLSHKALFDLANIDYFGQRTKPLFMPKTLARIGVWGTDLLGQIPRQPPVRTTLDDQLPRHRSRRRRLPHSYQRLQWRPRKRLLLQRRMPFMVEYRRTNPNEWHRVNRAALKEVHLRANLRINRLLEKYLDSICTSYLDQMLSPGSAARFPSYQNVPRDVLEWRFMILLRHLQSSIRTRDRGLFTTYCRDLAEKRLMQGFGVREVVGALLVLNGICVDSLRGDPEAEDLSSAIHDYVSMTIQFGCDQILEIYEEVGGEEIEDDF